MQSNSGRVEAKIAALGLELPEPPVPVGSYRPFRVAGGLVFTSGQTARINGVRRYVGVIGQSLSIEDGYNSARDSALNCLACLKAAIDDLDRITAIIKVTGFVNCIEGFTQHPDVINGASDLLIELFGENGTHARSAIGAQSLPSNVSVELELIATFAV